MIAFGGQFSAGWPGVGVQKSTPGHVRVNSASSPRHLHVCRYYPPGYPRTILILILLFAGLLSALYRLFIGLESAS